MALGAVPPVGLQRACETENVDIRTSLVLPLTEMTEAFDKRSNNTPWEQISRRQVRAYKRPLEDPSFDYIYVTRIVPEETALMSLCTFLCDRISVASDVIKGE